MDIQDERLRELADYLTELRGDREFPRPADFDITRVWSVAGYVNLVEVTNGAGGPSFRFRLYGTKAAELHRRDHHGMDLDELSSEREREQLRRKFLHVIESRQPEHSVFKTRIPMHQERTYVRVEGLIWPMSEDGENIDRLLTCSSQWNPVDDPNIDDIPDGYS